MKKKSAVDGSATTKSNPFEEQWLKKTKIGSSVKKRGRSNSNALTFSIRNKVQDQRVGEKNPKLSEEDRYLARLQRERSRGSKKRKRFNLSEDVDDGERGGQEPDSKQRKNEEFPMKDPTAWKYFVLNEQNDDYQEDSDGDDSDAEGTTKKAASKPRVNKNLGDSDSDSSAEPRTRQEIMHEVMMKSKMHKEQRQQVKAADEIQREALDETLPELISMLEKSRGRAPVDRNDDTKTSFNYEATLQALTKERRAQPTQRMKTEEEKEAEERERLEELERTRLARMRGTDEVDEDDVNLDDSDDSEDIDDNTENMQDGDEVEIVRDGQIENLDDVPYLFKKCPATPTELASVLLQTSVPLRGHVIERLLKSFVVSLSSTNGPKLQRLLQLLLGRVQALARSVKDVSLALQEIEIISLPCYKLASKYPALLIEWAKERLYAAYSDMQENQGEKLSACWPIAHLIILRFIGLLFPGSDVRHSVMTPFFILLSEAINPARLESDKDFAMATCLCHILLEVFSSTTRTSGQVVQFLSAALRKYPDFEESKATCSASDAKTNLPSPLLVSDLVMSEEPECAAHLPVKLGFTVRKLAQAALYRGRIPNIDLLYGPVSDAISPNERSQSMLRKHMKEQGAARKPLTLYTEKAAIPKGLNPKFTATNGVFKKNPRSRFGAPTEQQAQDSVKRIRKALNREERAYARDLRNEASERAQRQYEAESAKRDYANAKTKELKLFLEEQQSTWNKAEKKQKQLSGKKW